MKSETLYDLPVLPSTVQEFIVLHNIMPMVASELAEVKRHLRREYGMFIGSGIMMIFAICCLLALFIHQGIFSSFWSSVISGMGLIAIGVFLYVIPGIHGDYKELKACKEREKEEVDVPEGICFLRSFKNRQQLLTLCVERMNHYLAHRTLGLKSVYEEDPEGTEISARYLLDKALEAWEEDVELAALLITASHFDKREFLKVYEEKKSIIADLSSRSLVDRRFARIQLLLDLDEDDYKVLFLLFNAPVSSLFRVLKDALARPYTKEGTTPSAS